MQRSSRASIPSSRSSGVASPPSKAPDASARSASAGCPATRTRFLRSARSRQRDSILRPVHEPDRLPGVVDRARLVVDEPGLEPDRLNGVEVEVGGDSRRLLRPRDPETVGGLERLLQLREAPPELI